MNDEGSSRRRFLTAVTVGGSGVIAAGIAVPAVPYVLDPILADRAGGDGGAPFVRLARLDALPVGTPRKLTVVGEVVDAWTRTPARALGSVWASREGNRVRVLSTTCPHLGCPIGLTPDARAFACPCHDSKFGLDGARADGPSPRGMDPLATRVRDGVVEVRFQRFKQGTEQREVIADCASRSATIRSRRA